MNIRKAVILGLFCCLLFSITSCDWGAEIVEIRFQQYPTKIAYIKGHDTDLILDGCKILTITKNGTQDTYNLDEWESHYIVKKNIDFNRAGVYIVKLEFQFSQKVSCDFAIEVIDPATILK